MLGRLALVFLKMPLHNNNIMEEEGRTIDRMLDLSPYPRSNKTLTQTRQGCEPHIILYIH